MAISSVGQAAGRQQMVKVLLKAGADPQRQDDRGDRALDRAAAGGHDPTVQLLLDACGQPIVMADALMHAADHAGVYGRMATYARLVFELHKRYPAESIELCEFEYDDEDPGPLPRLVALLEAWNLDTRGIRGEQAAVRAQLHDLVLVKRGVQELVVGMGCICKYAP
jgi:hypothetical protein